MRITSIWPATGDPHRLRLLCGILGVWTVAVAVTWCWEVDDSTWPVIVAWSGFATTLLLVASWWLFLSGFAWKRRLRVFGSALLAVAAFFTCFRFTGLTGDLAPLFEFRWNKFSEQKAADFWQNRPALAMFIGGTRESVARLSGNEPDLPQTADDWPQFDGPGRDGIARGARVRTDWDREPPRQIWRHPVGAGWSSFAIVGKYAFTQEERGNYEGVICYEAATGKEVWSYLEPWQRYDNPMAGVGPRATPTIAGSRVYAIGATGVFNSINARDGRVVWQHSIAIEAGIHHLQWGMSASPLVYDNLVVVNPGGPRRKMQGTETSGRALVAYERTSGKEVWASGDYQAGYASPILATLCGVRQIVVFDGVGAGGYDAATGKELWRSPEWTNEFDINVAQPIILRDGGILLSSGYGTGSMLLDVKRTGSEWSTTARWTAHNRFKLKMNTAVCRDGCVYGLDEGILACLDLATGKERWKKGRYGYGQVLLMENALLVITEEGDLVLVDVSPQEGRELARYHAIDGKTWNVPAISGSRLFVRNAEEAACYDLGPLLQTASAAH